jgi:hypothetical protein
VSATFGSGLVVVSPGEVNLRAGGYERATLPGKVSDSWHFRAGLATYIRVWLRRFIGYLLVKDME